jgi:hypothetical protein
MAAQVALEQLGPLSRPRQSREGTRGDRRRLAGRTETLTSFRPLRGAQLRETGRCRLPLGVQTIGGGSTTGCSRRWHRRVRRSGPARRDSGCARGCHRRDSPAVRRPDEVLARRRRGDVLPRQAVRAGGPQPSSDRRCGQAAHPVGRCRPEGAPCGGRGTTRCHSPDTLRCRLTRERPRRPLAGVAAPQRRGHRRPGASRSGAGRRD